jgi:hypothetical protein
MKRFEIFMVVVLVIGVSTVHPDDLFSKKDHEIGDKFNGPEIRL